MIYNWLNPTKKDDIAEEIPFGHPQLGAKVHFVDRQDPSLQQVDVVIVGKGPQADIIRKALYRMTHFSPPMQLADLGNFINFKPSSVLPVLKEILNAGILPILLGFNQEEITILIEAIAKAKEKRLRPMFIDDKIGLGEGFSRSYLNPILEKEQSIIDDIAVLGFQQHYSDIEDLRKLFPFTRGLRLGGIKSHIQEAEPYIRDADLLLFMLSALKHAEAPAQLHSNPSGLFSEEACQLCKYAGLNEQLDFFAIGNFDLQYDLHDQSATLIAQMVWYFIYGVQNRFDESQKSENHFTKYMVNPDEMEEGFIFYKSEQTGRWWVRKQTDPDPNDKKNPLRACSYEDYVACTHNTITERLLELFQHAF